MGKFPIVARVGHVDYSRVARDSPKINGSASELPFPQWGTSYACAVAVAAGRVKQKHAPRGELSAAHKRPPCDSMMERLMLSPMPVPCGLVVKKALNIWSVCCGG